MCLRIVEEVGPVWVSLHVPELKQLSEAKSQDVEADLRQKQRYTLILQLKQTNNQTHIYVRSGSVLLGFGVSLCSLHWQRAQVRKDLCTHPHAQPSIIICTSFFSSWERLSALSSGNPGTSSVVRTWRLLSSSITSGT